MFELLLFDADSTGRLRDGQSFLRRLRQLRAAGAPRETTNREYFRWWAGREVAEVEDLGRNWFQGALREHGENLIFHSMSQNVQNHRAQQHKVVLVSGSFAPALSPLATYINADDVLNTSAIVHRGRYTGEISEPMIGEGKATAVAAHAARHRLDLRRSYGYGDDISDIPFMELTGNRVIVNSSDSAMTFLSSSPGCSQRNTSWLSIKEPMK